MKGSWGRMALALVLSAVLLHDAVVCDETTMEPADDVPPVDTAADNMDTAADNVDTAADNMDTAADNVDTAADNVDTAADNVDTAADNVDTAADNMDTAADNVDTAADNVDTAADNVDTAADNVDTAADNVDTAADNVDTEADNVDTAADNVDTAADNVDTAADNVDTAADNVDTAVDDVTIVTIPTVEATMPSTEKSLGDIQTTDTLTTATSAVPAGAADPTVAEPAPLDTTQALAASTAAPETASALAATQEVQTDSQQTTEAATSGPATDLVANFATDVPTDTQTSEQTPENRPTVFQTMTASPTTAKAGMMSIIIQCVEKETVIGKDAVRLELKMASSCEITKNLMEKHATDLCDDCKLDIFHEENSSFAIVTGSKIEDDVMAMANKFNSEPIKNALGLVEATPRWGEHPPTVLVALLIAGLALAALLIGGYAFKERRSRRAKGMRLAEESYQADEENQGNTLVSVAPLNPPSPQEKPTINGESPKGVKIEPPPAATNGHSTAKAPVADTEL